MTRRHGATARATGAVDAAHTALGVALLAAPHRMLGLVGEEPRSRGARAFVLVLGARHVAQAGLTSLVPAEVGARLGVGIDAVHAATMLPWAALARDHRRAALLNAAVAGAFAVAGASAARAGGRG